MAILLDTNALLWHVASHPRLTATAKQWIDDPTQEVFVSIASLWEITIKSSLGKLQLHLPLPILLQQHLLRSDVQLLRIEPVHLIRLSTLPHLHRDPFDRLIVAQALEENLPLVSADAALDAYGIQRLWQLHPNQLKLNSILLLHSPASHPLIPA